MPTSDRISEGNLGSCSRMYNLNVRSSYLNEFRSTILTDIEKWITIFIRPWNKANESISLNFVRLYCILVSVRPTWCWSRAKQRPKSIDVQYVSVSPILNRNSIAPKVRSASYSSSSSTVGWRGSLVPQNINIVPKNVPQRTNSVLIQVPHSIICARGHLFYLTKSFSNSLQVLHVRLNVWLRS